METATHLGLPWRLLREKLAPIQSDAVPTDVHYTLTLRMLDTDLIVSTDVKLINEQKNSNKKRRKKNMRQFPQPYTYSGGGCDINFVSV